MMRFLFAALLFPLAAQALQVGDAVLPDRWDINDHALMLNGAGLREYGFLKIDVYAAALYLPSKLTNERQVLASTEPRVLHMQFFRDVSREDTIKAWDHYFAENCKAPCSLPQQEIAAFKKIVPETITGDTQTYVFQAEAVELLRNGISIGRVQGAAFSRLLLSTWIGDVPSTAELKAKLLGGK